MSDPQPRTSVRPQPGHCYDDICGKALPKDYVVCPKCNEASKESRLGAEIAYCNDECRTRHWHAAHRIECSTILQCAKHTKDTTNASELSLEQLRNENAKIPKILGTALCNGCGRPKDKELKVCQRCLVALYCSRDCQVADWKKHKPDCKKPFTPGWKSPLYRCIESGDIQGLQNTLNYIKDKGLSQKHIDYQDEKGGSSSALYLAVENHMTCYPFIEMIIKAGANVNQPFRGYTPLMECTMPIPGRDVRISLLAAKQLLQAGADPNVRDFMGMTALISATRGDNHQLVRLLLEAGAEVDDRENNGASALFAAAMDGSIESMKVLHEYNADPTLVCKDNRSPLDVAVENGHLLCVKYLVEHMGADVNRRYRNAEGFPITPLLLAKLVKRRDMIDYLKSKGAR